MTHRPLRKAVIPAAGFGTRMLPAAKAVPKELLPILDRPTIQYVIEEAAAGGIEDVLLVTSRDKRAIEDHFDRNAELEQRLKAGGKESLLASVNELAARVKIHSVRQPEQRGLGDAVAQARKHVGDEPFICLLGDTIFSGGDEGPTAQLAAAYREFGSSVIGLEEVPLERVSRYGIVGGAMLRDGVMKLDTLVEKPSRENAPSRFAIAARYVLTPAIFQCLASTSPGKGGEIQLTDALRALLAREPIYGVVLKSRRHDIGNPIDWLRTNLMFAARDPAMWEQIAPLARELLSR
ncbi:MAG TPA: UTP--glucose-1-phosphate uridylyltransferase GalU [Tepidisphaeraceae bacterium]|nr:UTP--glucose-1-phosphate uridylyltransferase GalU [Tepidisphaeraceae bacterium]